MGFLNTIVFSVMTTTSRRRDLRLPVEGWWRLGLAFVFTLGSIGNSPNPWGNLRDVGGLSQALFIVGILQLSEFIVVLIKANPSVVSSRRTKRSMPRVKP